MNPAGRPKTKTVSRGTWEHVPGRPPYWSASRSCKLIRFVQQGYHAHGVPESRASAAKRLWICNLIIDNQLRFSKNFRARPGPHLSGGEPNKCEWFMGIIAHRQLTGCQ